MYVASRSDLTGKIYNSCDCDNYRIVDYIIIMIIIIANTNARGNQFYLIIENSANLVPRLSMPRFYLMLWRKLEIPDFPPPNVR